MSGSRVLVLPLMIDLVTWKSDTMNAIQKAMFNNHPIPRSAINHNKYKLCTINELPKKYSHHLRHEPLTARITYGKTKYGSEPHTTKLYSFVYWIDSAWPLWMSFRYTEIQTNEWESVPTYSCLPTTYRPPTDHLPSTEHLPTTYQHLLNSYRPPTNHFFTVQLVHDYHQYTVILRHYTG